MTMMTYSFSMVLMLIVGRLWERERTRENIKDEIAKQLKDRFGGWPVTEMPKGGWPMRTWKEKGE
jgi:hypothetical protein